MTKEKKEIEYPDAPSGYITLYNYKEPFMPFHSEIGSESFGYEGVLLFDGSSDRVQCHFCGKWFESLGSHIGKEHGIKAADYKNMVGLSKNTALIGDKFREKLIANGKERFKNLRPGVKKTQAEKDKISATLRKETREYQNLRGTCPMQLIDRLKNKSRELGRCPTRREIGFLSPLENVFGTFSKACIFAGLNPLKPGQTLQKTKYDKAYYLPIVRDFWINNHKMPRMKDFRNSNEWAKYKALKKEIEKEVLFGEKVFHKTPVRITYSKEELINLLRIFKEVNKRDASISDCKRGLLPHASRYYYHFGNLKKALELV